MSTVGTIIAAATHRQMSRRSTKTRLFDLQVEVEIAEVRARIEAARMRRHRHDLANALAGVEGAFTLIADETLNLSDRARLMEMLVSGVSHLRSLVSAGPGENRSALADLMTSLTADPHWRDRVRVEVAPDMVVAGSPDEIMEAVRRLVAHTIDRSPSGRVIVRARRSSDGDRIELWVDNDGVQDGADDDGDTGSLIRRPGSGSGSAIALEVAIRLAEGQHGEVRFKAEPGDKDVLQFSWPVPVE